MEQADVRNLSVFFFLSLLDGPMAIDFTQKAKVKFLESTRKNGSHSREFEFVQVTNRMMQDKVFDSRFSTFDGAPGGFEFPDNFDIVPWKEFRRKSSMDEISVLIWSKVLKIPDHEIASALAISEGTVKYRLAKATQKLGRLAVHE